ncbi:MAG: hypothetical protein QXH97_00355 [Candidatus Bathyarchaeia archaeon]
MGDEPTKTTNRSKTLSTSDDEIITTQTFPRLYLETPAKAQELVNKVSGVQISRISSELPQYLLKKNVAAELRSKWQVPAAAPYTFFKTYGGALDEYAWAITKTVDGNYIFGGRSWSYPQLNVPLLLIKVNDYGEIIWAKIYGGGGVEWIRGLKQHPNGGYILAGYSTSSSAGDRDILILHISENGAVNWARVIGTTARDEGRFAYVTPDGGVIILGFTWAYGATTPQPLIIKLDPNLNIQYAYVYQFSESTYLWGFIPTLDGNYLAIGAQMINEPPWDYGIAVKVNSSADFIWARRVSGDDSIRFIDCEQLNTGEYVIVGYSYAFKLTDADILVTKMTATGSLTKTVILGGSGTDFAYKVIQDSEQNIVCCGVSASYSEGSMQGAMCKLDGNLSLIHFSYLGGPPTGEQWEELRDLCESHDGGYIFTGYSPRYGYLDYDYILIKTNRQLQMEDCAIIRSATPSVMEVSPNVTELTPTIIDVKTSLQINTPNYVSYDVSPIVRVGCPIKGWDAYMEEEH